MVVVVQAGLSSAAEAAATAAAAAAAWRLFGTAYHPHAIPIISARVRILYACFAMVARLLMQRCCSCCYARC